MTEEEPNALVDSLDLASELLAVGLRAPGGDGGLLDEVVLLESEEHPVFGVLNSRIGLGLGHQENYKVLLDQVGVQADDLVHHRPHLGVVRHLLRLARQHNDLVHPDEALGDGLDRVLRGRGLGLGLGVDSKMLVPLADKWILTQIELPLILVSLVAEHAQHLARPPHGQQLLFLVRTLPLEEVLDGDLRRKHWPRCLGSGIPLATHAQLAGPWREIRIRKDMARVEVSRGYSLRSERVLTCATHLEVEEGSRAHAVLPGGLLVLLGARPLELLQGAEQMSIIFLCLLRYNTGLSFRSGIMLIEYRENFRV